MGLILAVRALAFYNPTSSIMISSSERTNDTESTLNLLQNVFGFRKITILQYFLSFSCLQSLHNMNIDHPILSSILYNNHQAEHIGNYGNNKADMAAKSAHQFEVANSEFLIKFKNVLTNFIQILYGKYFGTFMMNIKMYCIQNKVNKPYHFKTNLSFQEYVQGIQNLLIRTSYRGSNSRNAYLATAK